MKETAESIFNELLNDKKLATKRGDDESFAYGRIPFNIPQLDRMKVLLMVEYHLIFHN